MTGVLTESIPLLEAASLIPSGKVSAKTETECQAEEIVWSGMDVHGISDDNGIMVICCLGSSWARWIKLILT